MSRFLTMKSQSAFIHTPHIAGYSVQAKLNASGLVTDALCRFFNLEISTGQSFQSKEIELIPPAASPLTGLLKYLHPIDDYHQKFSALIGQSDDLKSDKFRHIRTASPLRNEYHSIQLTNEAEDRFPEFVKIFKSTCQHQWRLKLKHGLSGKFLYLWHRCTACSECSHRLPVLSI